MSDPSLALQGAVVARLKADAPVAALIGTRVYDEVPTSATFPYVVVGDGQVIGDDDDCADVSEVTFQVHAWTRSPADTGWPKSKQIAAAVRTAMKAPFTLVGFDVLLGEFTQIQFLKDPDGLTRHAMVEFRFLIVHS
jgi:hypothetical protein